MNSGQRRGKKKKLQNGEDGSWGGEGWNITGPHRRGEGKKKKYKIRTPDIEMKRLRRTSNQKRNGPERVADQESCWPREERIPCCLLGNSLKKEKPLMVCILRRQRAQFHHFFHVCLLIWYFPRLCWCTELLRSMTAHTERERTRSFPFIFRLLFTRWFSRGSVASLQSVCHSSGRLGGENKNPVGVCPNFSPFQNCNERS